MVKTRLSALAIAVAIALCIIPAMAFAADASEESAVAAAGSVDQSDARLTTATVAYKNLLKNPGAETGDLTGWKDSSKEKCWMVGFEGNIKGWDHQAARSGKYYFMTGWPSESNSKRYLYQDVNITSYKGKTLTFSAYLGGYGHTDKGGIKLAILDKSGKVIESKASKMYEANLGDWSKRLSVSLDVPDNAYKARAYLVGELHQGAEADAYFDDASLTVSGSNKLGKVKGLKLTNKKGRYIYYSLNAVSGAGGYQAQLSAKSSMKLPNTYNGSAKKGYFLHSGKKETFAKGQTFYVRFRAYKKTSNGNTVYGAWSDIAKVKITK